MTCQVMLEYKGFERAAGSCHNIWQRWEGPTVMQLLTSMLQQSSIPYRNQPLASNIGSNIPSHLAVAVDYTFSDSSSESGSSISHC